MKRDELIGLLLAGECVLERHGGRRDICSNPSTGLEQPVPRHREIDEHLARHILKYPGLR